MRLDERLEETGTLVILFDLDERARDGRVVAVPLDWGSIGEGRDVLGVRVVVGVGDREIDSVRVRHVCHEAIEAC